MLKKELEKEIKELEEVAKSFATREKIWEDDCARIEKELREKNVRLEVINRDNTDALKTSTLYIKMLLRNMYTQKG